MTIVGIHHVQITIPTGAEEKARRFYCDLLGLTEIAKPAALQSRGGFWLQLGRLQLHIGTENGIEPPATKAHVAYEVANLPSMKSLLQEAGVTILDSIPIPGYNRCEFRDPFGNRIELIESRNS